MFSNAVVDLTGHICVGFDMPCMCVGRILVGVSEATSLWLHRCDSTGCREQH